MTDPPLPPVMAFGSWKTNAELIRDVARLGYLRPEWKTLDVTWGLGAFWTLWRPDDLVGCDLDPAKSPIGYPVDFTALPFADRSFEKADRFDFPSYRPQPPGRAQIHARRNTSQLLIFQRCKG